MTAPAGPPAAVAVTAPAGPPAGPGFWTTVGLMVRLRFLLLARRLAGGGWLSGGLALLAVAGLAVGLGVELGLGVGVRVGFGVGVEVGAGIGCFLLGIGGSFRCSCGVDDGGGLWFSGGDFFLDQL